MRHGLRIMLMGAAIGLAAPAFARGESPAAEPAMGGPTDAPAYLTDTPGDLAAILDARIAALKTVLQLTPDQAALWPAVEAVIRDNATKARARADARYEGPQPADFLEVLTRITRAEAERGAGINAFVEAFGPLAQTLSTEQMRRVPPFLGMIDYPYGEQPSAQIWIVEE